MHTHTHTHTYTHTHLRSNVIGSATECSGLVGTMHTLLAQTKVSNLDVTVAVQHHIVKFEVTVDDPKVVKEEQPKDYLSRVKPEKRTA